MQNESTPFIDLITKKSVSKKQKDNFDLQLQEVKSQYFPPFSSAVAIANAKIRFLKRVIAGGIVFFTGLLVFQQAEIHRANKVISNQNYLVLPVPDFMHARPGVIPDDVLFAFANWAVKQIEDFDYTTVRSQYKEMEIYMSPDMRVQFAFENEAKIKKYEKFAMRQVFSYGPPQHIVQKTDAKGHGYFEVEFDGTLHRYTNDQILKPLKEKLLLRFGTSALSKPNKSWLFEVLNVRRVVEKPDSDDEFTMPSDLISTTPSALESLKSATDHGDKQ